MEEFMSINNDRYLSPKDFFIGLSDFEFKIYGNRERLLIKAKVFEQEDAIGYMNIVYAIDLLHPIAKVYFSLSNNGIEFVDYRNNLYKNILKNSDSKLDLNSISCDWNTFLSDISIYDIGTISKNKFISLIGIGCIEANNHVITNLYHRSKLSPNVFLKIAKSFKNCEVINFNTLIQYGFNEIENEEIISIYEKKIIYQKILDHFISN